MEEYGMQFKRPSLKNMDESDRAGIFAAEYHINHAFNDAGKSITRTKEKKMAVALKIPAYIKEQEALFQQELTATKNSSDTPEPPSI